MADQFTWRFTRSGAWSVPGNWADLTIPADPATTAPGAADTATIAGPGGSATYAAIAGPGSAAGFTNDGNVGLSGGNFAFGTLSDGSSATSAYLDIGAGATVTATSVALNSNAVQVTGAGATLRIGTPFSTGTGFGGLNVSNQASVSLAGLSMTGYGSIGVDTTGTIEIGSGGGSAAAAGAVTVDPGATVSAVSGTTLSDGTISGLVIDNGTIAVGGNGAAGSYLFFTGPVSGSGSIVIGTGGLVTFEQGDGAPIAFTGTTGGLTSIGSVPTGLISGFTGTETIGFENLVFDTAVYAATGSGLGTLTLGQNGATAGTLSLAGSYGSSTTFLPVTDGYGDDSVVLAAGFAGAGSSAPSTGTSGTSFAWNATAGGDWGVASNWLDNGIAATVAPGASDTVTIAGAAARYQIVRGQGNSRSLSLTGDVALGGDFSTGAFNVGNNSGSSGVVVMAGATVSASSVAVAYYSSVLDVNGPGAVLAVSGALTDGNPDASSGAIVVTDGAKVTAASLAFQGSNGIQVDSTSTVDIGGTGGTAGFLTVETGAIVSGFGTISAATINNGIVESSQSFMTIDGAVTGAGTLLIGGGAPFALNGSVASTQTIVFGAQSESLTIDGVLPAAGISGFAVADTITTGTLAFDSASYAPSGGNGTVTLLSQGTSVGALSLLGGQPAGTSFIVIPDSGYTTTTELVLADGTLGAGASPAPAGTGTADGYQWTATAGGSWNTVANWHDSSASSTTLAPGSNDAVTITGSGGYFQAISGQGDAASLSMTGEFALGGIFQVGSLTTANGSAFSSTIQIVAGATLTAGSAAFGARDLNIVGSGALMTSPGTVAFNDYNVVNVVDGGTLIAAGATGNATFDVDSLSAVEIGTANDAIAGYTVIDSGATIGGGMVFGGPVIDNGVIDTGSSSVQLAGPVTGDGTIIIGSGGFLDLTSSVDAGITIEFADATGTLNLANSGQVLLSADLPAGVASAAHPASGVNAQIVGYTAGDTIDATPGSGGVVTIDSTSDSTGTVTTGVVSAGGTAAGPIDTAVYTSTGASSGTLAIGDNGTQDFALNLVGNYASEQFITLPGYGGRGGDVLMSVACFAAGTRLTTALGEIAVEDLRAGDLVRAEGAGIAPVKWIGHRRIDCRTHPAPRAVWPVRVRAGACGENMPHRDLFLSPDHAVYLDGVLVPARYLIDGSTIAQVPVDEVTYFHVELERHDVLLAEGLTVESYLDTGDRWRFSDEAGNVAAVPAFAARLWEAGGFAPLVIAGPVLAAVRRRLLDRAELWAA